MSSWKNWSLALIAFGLSFVASATLSSCGSDDSASLFSKVSVSFRE